MKGNKLNQSNANNQLRNHYQQFNKVILHCRNNREDYKDFEYVESDNLIEDIKRIIKLLAKYGFFLRTTEIDAKIHAVNFNKYIKLLGANGKFLKSKTTFNFSRVKYILNHPNLSKLAKIRLISDRTKIKVIEVDHKDKNTLNNNLSNLHAIPRKVNQNKDYRNMQSFNLPANRIKYAKENDCEYLLTFF